jgi:FkbH-like protein
MAALSRAIVTVAEKINVPKFAEPIRLIIWDLDETFWRGTLEEGSVVVPPEHAELVKTLAGRGIVSAICSRNDPKTAKARLEQSGLWEWFVFPRIAYTFKSVLINDIVEQIGLRPETVLFIDDNPFNRADAAEFVTGINVADPSIIPELLQHAQLRGKPDSQLTRLQRYRVLESKQAEYTSSTDRTPFLRGCEIVVSIHFDIENQFDRIHELVNRTNQLNFTKERWEEAVEEAREEYLSAARKNYGIHAGYVKVRDRYGYYGVCGFFEARRRAATVSLEHFLFSCRVLNMGVEQFIYQHLEYPKIKKAPGTVSELSDSQVVDWITIVADAELEGGATAHETRLKLCLHGPCELVQSAHYLRPFLEITEEFQYPRRGWRILRPLLRNLILKDELQQKGIASCVDLGLPGDFGGIDFSALGSAFFDGKADICIWSFSMQSHEAIYKHSATGLVFPLSFVGSFDEVDITSLSIADTIETTRVRESDIKAAKESFTFIGSSHEEQFKADLRALREKLQKIEKPFIVLESFDDVTKINRPPYRSHGAINKKVRAGLAGMDNVHYIRFSDCVSDDSEEIAQNHFVRDVYLKLATQIRELISVVTDTERKSKDQEPTPYEGDRVRLALPDRPAKRGHLSRWIGRLFQRGQTS